MGCFPRKWSGGWECPFQRFSVGICGSHTGIFNAHSLEFWNSVYHWHTAGHIVSWVIFKYKYSIGSNLNIQLPFQIAPYKCQTHGQGETWFSFIRPHQVSALSKISPTICMLILVIPSFLYKAVFSYIYVCMYVYWFEYYNSYLELIAV